VALLAAVVTVTVLTLNPVGAGSPAHRVAERPPARPTPAHRPAIALPQPTPSPTHRVRHISHPRAAPANPAPAPTSPADLEARGHSLMVSGQYASAVSVLRQAVQATGATAASCAQPTSQTCLTYAFALYDLGRSLRLSGDPTAAIPVLKQRLEINNQHSAVAEELALALGNPSPTSPAGQLETQGHSLMDNGQYASAIPVLQQAIQATKENPGACAQPANQNCLTYAYALYDLGRALRLSGDSAAAVPILRQRLQINNQHDAVAQELALAQNSASH
jgi:tetratricopeptide (TPR) repeat protein